MVPCRVIPFAALVVWAGALGAADPDPKPAELIVGRWQGETTLTLGAGPGGKPKEEVFTRTVRAEFRKDGTFTLTYDDIAALKERSPELAKGHTVAGKYALVKDGEVEMTAEVSGKKLTQRAKVAVTKGELSVTPLEGGKAQPTQKFKRAKE